MVRHGDFRGYVRTLDLAKITLPLMGRSRCCPIHSRFSFDGLPSFFSVISLAYTQPDPLYRHWSRPPKVTQGFGGRVAVGSSKVP
ncbi:hypothetical protein BC936DRAFT_149843 [Jimgerdemannia flammicorona]|uniref:Uncharacterized protein n=1 Tax=Jimgerdemannia flammicorona TaxID=994334 RepID=A0A433D008_9FUNG|nr:hypothetical protein BC936DRAFT_149843 [Jimgerdemannia flammicorona]